MCACVCVRVCVCVCVCVCVPMSGLFILSVRYSVSGSSDSSVMLCVQGAGLFKNITQGMRQSRILVACVSDEVGNTPPPPSPLTPLSLT